MRLTLLIADKREIFRQALASLLHVRQDLEVVATCASGNKCITKVSSLRPEVVLIDTELDNVVDVVHKICTRSPSTNVIMMGHSLTGNGCLDMLKAGAKGFISKDTSISELVCAIHAVASGGITIHPPMAIEMLKELSSHKATTMGQTARNGVKLSSREQEILQLVAQGATNQEVADTLFISLNTVKVHIRNAMDKLNVHTRLRAALLAQAK